MVFSDYESPLLRGVQEPRPWNIQEEISILCKPDYHCLDLGCGTLFKWLPLLESVTSVTGLEVNDNMIRISKDNIAKQGKGRLKLVQGESAKLPFSDHSFDLVSAIMAPSACEPEVFRVLKPGGCYILETSTEQDQRNIKIAFGRDREGWRGYGCSKPPHSVHNQRYDSAKKWFGSFGMRLGRWKTWYSREALLLLLEQVGWIRNFHPDRDSAIIDKLLSGSTTGDSVETIQERILLIATKLKNQ